MIKNGRRGSLSGKLRVQGIQGPAGIGINFKGSVAAIANLPANPDQGDAYLVQADDSLRVWDTGTNSWVNGGSIQGPQGPAGVAAFKEELDGWLAHTAKQKYNGKSAPEVVLLAPLALAQVMPMEVRYGAQPRTVQFSIPGAAVPLVAVGDVHMHVRSRKPLHDVLTAVRLGQPVSACGFALQANAEGHLRSRARLAALFHVFEGSIGPIGLDAMESGARIAAWHLNEARRYLGELAMPAELANPLVFFAIDIIWLGAVAKGLYAKYLGGFLAPNVNWAAAIIFYLLFIIGIFPVDIIVV